MVCSGDYLGCCYQNYLLATVHHRAAISTDIPNEDHMNEDVEGCLLS